MPIERKLAAIMFTDIAGYTALSAKDENKALELLDKQKQILTPIIEEYNGILHNKGGDSLLFTFSTVTDAVKCGIKIQKQIKAVEDLNLRIGIHEGEITLKDGDVLGDDVNIASRIEPFSAVGGIAISGKVQQNISSLPEFETTHVSTPNLKGVAQRVEVYCITSHGLPKTDMSKVSAKFEGKSNFNIFSLTGGILTTIGIAFWIAVGIFDISFGGGDEAPSIAILPIANIGDKEDEYYAHGISSKLIADISTAGLIRLESIRKLDYKKLDNAEISKELSIRYIVQGTLWKNEDRFQLSIELYDTKKSKIIWSDAIEEKWVDIASIHIASNILEALNVSTKQPRIVRYRKNIELEEITKKQQEKYKRRNPGWKEGMRESAFTESMQPNFNNKSEYLAQAAELIAHKIVQEKEYYLKGKYRFDMGDSNDDLDSAGVFFMKAIVLNKDNVDAIFWMGKTHARKKEYGSAMQFYEQAYNLANRGNNNRYKELRGIILREMADVNLENLQYDKALSNYHKSLKIFDDVGDMRNKSTVLSNIGRIHSNHTDEVDSSIFYYEQCIIIENQLGDKRRLVTIANSYRNIGIRFKEKKDYDRAILYLEKYHESSKEINDYHGVYTALWWIGNIYSEKKEYDEALNYYKRSLDMDVNNDIIVDNFRMISHIYYDKGDYSQAAMYLEKLLGVLGEGIDSRTLKLRKKIMDKLEIPVDSTATN